MLLDYWKTLPPNVFAPKYFLTPGGQRVAIYDSWIRLLSQLDLLYLNNAYVELEPAYPLDNRKPRNAISETLYAPNRLDCFTLGTLWDLFSDVDTVLAEDACLKFINERGQKELEDESSFDCYKFTPSLQIKLTRMREEKLDLIVLGVLPSCSSSWTSSSRSGSGKSKRKTRREKKKSKKTGDSTETSDGIENAESSSSLMSATPPSSPASSLASSPDPKSLASEIDCGLPSKEEISAPPNRISFSAFTSSPSEPQSKR